MKKAKLISQIVFLIIGVATVCEYLFISGSVTSFIMMALVAVSAIVNIVFEAKDKNIVGILNYVLTAVALCMGYFILICQELGI